MKISKKALSAKLNDVLRPERLHSIREAFLDTWPEARAYLEIHARLCSHGQTACVEQYYSKRIRGGLKYSEACNTRFQGIIADAAKSAGWALSREMYTGTSVLRGSRIVNFPHDEFIVEVPEPIGHECAQAIQEIVLREVGKYLPDVPPKALPYLARYWSKKGFPIVKDGKLTPWNGEKKV